MKKQLIIAIISLLVSACNHDVFIDGPLFPDESVPDSSIPGRSLKLLKIDYGTLFTISDETVITKSRIDNPVDSARGAIIYPFLNHRGVIRVEALSDKWLTDSVIKMPVPVCDQDRVWTLSDTINVTIGQNNRYGGPEQNTKVPLTVPANFRGVVETSVVYAGAEATGTFTFLDVKLDRRFESHFSATVYYPLSYTLSLVPD